MTFDSAGTRRAPLPLETFVPELVDAGLMGIEVYYPNYDAQTIEYLLTLARRFGLLTSGGTDFHSIQAERVDLGGVYVPMKVYRRLKTAWEGLRA